MLVTRQCDTGRNTWSSSKLEAIYHKSASPRMSNFEPLPTQPDWREQYSTFPLPGENGLLQPSFDQSTTPNVSESNQNQQQNNTRPTLGHRHSLGPLLQDVLQPAPAIERPDSAPGDCGHQANPTRDDSLVSTESAAPSLASGSNPLSSASSAPAQQGTLANNEEGSGGPQSEIKDEEDDDDDDDEMLDQEDGAPPQTAAERRAERRKMKRFRLTHQQTRFLMSEFAKQAHPDAAHRERLSREIPGLSPRQVQVWFQNRRAKIKRLTADDRERMMKMRAVPDDFDNVQALHSPYGAVQGIGTPMQSPVDFVPGYTDHMMRPLMVDTMRRNDHDDHISPTGLSPAFGHVGFAPAGSMGSPDVLSPLSLNSSDRYFPGSSHLSSPMSAGPRSSTPFDRQNSYQALSHSRQLVRPLQPLQLRETMSRSRSESLQSPLRSSMSWKGENIDYNSYNTGQASPQLSGRQQSAYQPDQIGNSSVNPHQYEANAFSNSNIQSSPTQMTYSQSHSGPSSSVQQSGPSTISRLRASSSAFPPSLDLRNQYRPLQTQHNSPHGTTPRSSSFASAFTGGYASAPLTAPVDFSLPRTPVDGSQGSRNFNIPQTAPMNPPQDFTSAYNSTISPARAQHGDRNFGGQGQNNQDQGHQGQGQGSGQAGDQQHQSKGNEETSYLTGHKRKRSFTISGPFESP
ncbi:Homeobox protein HD-10 [Lachnellula cervina]|uniref:Homeobox protein HD-10 n=1 Tax=Lachnellula cervina TaxID=1316786 RepID=A0A7D8URX2_9HELO|nr:Homeobox protein HD-10 [Lachnellula cervina]